MGFENSYLIPKKDNILAIKSQDTGVSYHFLYDFKISKRYNHPPQNGGHKTKRLEHFIETLRIGQLQTCSI